MINSDKEKTLRQEKCVGLVFGNSYAHLMPHMGCKCKKISLMQKSRLGAKYVYLTIQFNTLLFCCKINFVVIYPRFWFKLVALKCCRRNENDNYDMCSILCDPYPFTLVDCLTVSAQHAV